jgi:hypothetical protein
MACVLALAAISVVATRWSGALPEALARFGERTPDVELVEHDHTT